VTRIEIVVDELIVRGLDPHAARAAAAELETRLATLAGNADVPIRAREESFRRLPGVEAAPGGVGDAVANAVWGAVSGSGRR
jgi:hypothetical protein